MFLLLTGVTVVGATFGSAAGASKPTFIITGSGQQIPSVFDGLLPNQYVRDVLVLRTDRSKRVATLNLDNRPRGQMFWRMLVAAPPVYFSCPPGNGACLVPGTTGEFGQHCSDGLGCEQDVNNPVPTLDPTQGTQELYVCEICCVDWHPCTIGGTDPPAPPGPSPIIIDIEGQGFHLTSAVAGVSFDMSGTGQPVQVAWTDPKYRNAFLALPGPDGLVHNGKELFGNFTPQPPSDQPNGFIALAEYDKPASGGNGDGIIDARDAVFSRLVLWIDENHDGISQPNELHSLPSLGVMSLSLKYHVSWRQDEYGNLFRDRGSVNSAMPQNDSTVGPSAYDVFLTTPK